MRLALLAAPVLCLSSGAPSPWNDTFNQFCHRQRDDIAREHRRTAFANTVPTRPITHQE
jgi:hypothetical protein